MAIFLLYCLTATTIVAALARPWIGVVAYYTLAILNPQSAWPWVFQETRTVLAVSLATIVGFAIKLISGKIDFQNLWHRQNLFILLIWLALILSFFLSPYGIGEAQIVRSFTAGSADLVLSNITDSRTVLSNFNKVFIFYFISILLINNKYILHIFSTVIIITIIYFVYWGNYQYFSGQMVTPRLGGPSPGHGMYGDENTFAMVFVVSMPFLFFMGKYYKSIIVRYFLWSIIPLAWHVIFLTGSLGGVISLGVTTLLMALLSRSKVIKILFPGILIIALLYQGGPFLLDRLFSEGGDVTKVSSAQQRFGSWKAGVEMIKDHPITGVGIANYITAFPDYDKSGSQPLVAHNTFFQLTAESGIFAGLFYLLLFTDAVKQIKFNIMHNTDSNYPIVIAIKNSVVCSLAGFFFCGLFLNLASFEIFYFLLIINLSQQTISVKN